MLKFFFYHEGGSRIYQSPSGESDGVFRVSGNFFLIELGISIAVMAKILSGVKNQMPLHRIISFTRKESLDNRWTFAKFIPQKNKNFSAPDGDQKPQPTDDRWDSLTTELLRLRWQAKVQVQHMWQPRHSNTYIELAHWLTTWVSAAQWLECLTSHQNVVGSITVWGSEIFLQVWARWTSYYHPGIPLSSHMHYTSLNRAIIKMALSNNFDFTVTWLVWY